MRPQTAAIPRGWYALVELRRGPNMHAARPFREKRGGMSLERLSHPPPRWRALSLAAGVALAISCARHIPATRLSLVERLPLALALTPVWSYAVRRFVLNGAWQRLSSFPASTKLRWVLGSLLAGCLLVLVIPVEVAGGSTPSVAALGLQGVDAVSIGILAFTCGVRLCMRTSSPPSPPEASRRAWLIYAALCGACWTFWLLVFWPGLMSPDSAEQWGQMATGKLDDWHPAFGTLTYWLLTRAWLSPAAVGLTQIVALSLTVGWGLARIRQLGTPPGIVNLACAVLALSPVNGTMIITLWKDVPYGICLLALSLLILEIVLTRGAWLERRGRWALLGSLAALVALYRHNGFAAAFGTLAVLLAAYPWRWRPLAGALLVAVGIWLGVRGPLYDRLGVTPQPVMKYLPAIHHAAAHVAAGTFLEEDEREFLESIHTLADGWRYDPYCIDSTIFRGGFNWQRVQDQPDRFMKVFWSLARRNPRVNTEHVVRSSSLIWRVWPPSGEYLFATYLGIKDGGQVITIATTTTLRSGKVVAMHEVYPEVSFPVPASRLPGAQLPLAVCVRASQGRGWFWLIWQPALYLYLLLGGIVIALCRSGWWRYALVLTPVLLHTLLMVPATLAQDVRYQYPVYLVSLVLSGWLLFGIPLPRAAAEGQP
jgi:hypothetical protein